MEKEEVLQEWRKHLIELNPKLLEQIDWIQTGEVVASKKDSCPKELEKVAENLVKIQNQFGEYQRNKIEKNDIETIKYISKKKNLSFDDTISLAVQNSRYVSKSAIEARGVLEFISEIQAVYKKYYEKYGVFPINAMSAESKRNCRSIGSGISLKEKVETIISVYLPEMNGINIVEEDFSILPKSRFELSEADIKNITNYFKKHSKNGLIDECFDYRNQDEFIKVSRLLARANMSVDEFLKNFTNLSYTKCYSAQTVPAVTQMILAYKAKHGTTRRITDNDPYLRNKIEVAQKLTGQYTMSDLVKFLDIVGDNLGDGRSAISESELHTRHRVLLDKLTKLYPSGVIDKDFINQHSDLYLELELLSRRYGKTSKDEYLKKYGFKRESSHERNVADVIYLSEDDLKCYKFGSASIDILKRCNLQELEPLNYFGVYNKLVFNGYDSKEAIINGKKLSDE